MRQHIRMMIAKETYTFEETGHNLIPTKGIKGYFTRFLWRRLFKLRVMDIVNTKIYSFNYTINQQQELADRLSDQVLSMLNNNYALEQLAIIVGLQQFEELVDQKIKSDQHIRTYCGEFQFGLNGRVTYCDLPIHVIPQIDGIAVIPKIVVER